MTKVINMTLDPASIDKAIRELRSYQRWVRRKGNELAERLAEMGAVNVSIEYARAIYTGEKQVYVTVEKIADNKFAIVASGHTVLFLEFGAGVTYGEGHPLAAEMGYGPGTWPDKHYSYNSNGQLVENWENDRGWYLPITGEHTYGNPPSMAMYMTARELEREVERIAKEVFST